MRISVDKSDRGFEMMKSIRENKGTVAILLDGEIVKNAITADEEEGFVLRYKANSEGVVEVHDVGEEAVYLTETLTGTVIIMVGQK